MTPSSHIPTVMLALFRFATILYAILPLLTILFWKHAVFFTTTVAQLPSFNMFILKALYPDSLEEHACRDQTGGKDSCMNENRFYSTTQLEKNAR